MHRRVYRLEPIAEADDPNWGRAPNRGAVIVRADSPADARVLASQAETDFLDVGAKPSHGVSTDFASAFRDDRLYSVREDDSGRFANAGERAVLAGAITDGRLKV
jgi:hypothetical protein